MDNDGSEDSRFESWLPFSLSPRPPHLQSRAAQVAAQMQTRQTQEGQAASASRGLPAHPWHLLRSGSAYTIFLYMCIFFSCSSLGRSRSSRETLYFIFRCGYVTDKATLIIIYTPLELCVCVCVFICPTLTPSACA